jgi:hypothetical protein
MKTGRECIKKGLGDNKGIRSKEKKNDVEK